MARSTSSGLPRWLLREAIQYAPSSLIPAAAGFFLVPALTHLLAPAEYGQYSLIAIAVSVMDAVLVGWLSNSVLRFYAVAERNSELPGLLRYAIVQWMASSAVAFAVVYVTAHLIPDLLPLHSWQLIVTVGVLVSSAMGMDIAQQTVRAQLRPLGYSAARSAQAIFRLVGCVVGALIFSHDRLLGVFLGWMSASLLTLCGTAVYALAPVGRRLFVRTSRSSVRFRELLAFGGPVSVNLVLGLALANADRFLLQVLRGPSEVGLYAAAYTISSGALSTVNLLSSWPVYPRLTRLWEDPARRQEAPGVVKSGLRLFMILAIPATVGIMCLSDRIIGLLAPAGYSNAAPVMIPVVIGIFFLGLAQFTNLGLLLSKRTLTLSCVLVASGVVNIGLNLLLIPKYGLIAAGIVSSITFIFYAGVALWRSLKHLTYPIPWLSLGRTVGASAVMALVVVALGVVLPQASWVIFLLAAIGVCIYGSLLLLLREVELEWVLQFTRSGRPAA